MPAIGIMRYLCDNDYIFIAKKQKGNNLENIAVYHDNTSSSMGLSGPWKSVYHKAILINEGTVLATPDKKSIFTGDEQFLLFAITNEEYRNIFETAKKLHKEGKQIKLENYEFDGIMDAAFRAGFEERVVNGKPRAVCHGMIAASDLIGKRD